jgi:hypothetical protein
LLFFYSSRSHSYYKLAVLENIKSLNLEIHGHQFEDATVYAAKALLHASKAIVIHPINHEAYAIRAEINARYCKADEAKGVSPLANFGKDETALTPQPWVYSRRSFIVPALPPLRRTEASRPM